MKSKQTLLELTPAATFSQIRSVDPQAGRMLASIGLNPADYKNESLQSVCRQKQLSEVEVLRWIKKNCRPENGKRYRDNGSEEPDFGDNLSRWCTYLEEHNIAQTTELLDELSDAFPRVHQIHGNQYPWLKDIKWHFEQFEETLRMYNTFEQKRFYPLIKKLDNHTGEMLDGTLKDLQHCIEIISEDQQGLQELMSTIRTRGQQLENPPDACSSLRILNQNFKMLFSELNNQFKVEKEVIFPLLKKKLDDKNKW